MWLNILGEAIQETKTLTNATLEPTTLQSTVTTEGETKVAEMAPSPAAPGTSIGRISVTDWDQRDNNRSTPIQGKKRGLLNRQFHLLRDTSFQLGLSLPGKLWYRESQNPNAKDKAVLDAAMHGFL